MSIIHDKKTTEAFINTLGVKSYGEYTRNGKKFYRNYGRELKNGKGLNYFEVTADFLFEEYPLIWWLKHKEKHE